MTNKIYVIASTWLGSELTIEYFYSSSKCMKYLGELLNDEWDRKADPNDDPEEYVSSYYDWVRNEQDNFCDMEVELLTELKLFEACELCGGRYTIIDNFDNIEDRYVTAFLNKDFENIEKNYNKIYSNWKIEIAEKAIELLSK